MLTHKRKRFAFLFLAAPFFLNDFGFIALDGSYGVYLVDYATRALVIFVCFAWPTSREIIHEKSKINPPIYCLFLVIILLPVFGRTLYNFVEVPFVNVSGWEGLFQFGRIDDLQLYWLDLSLGLFAVALSEEIVFRRLALSWLIEARKPKFEIIIISALFFSLMHWGRGLGRIIYTFVWGAIYMAIYLKIGRLWPLVLAHWIEDFVAFGPFEIPIQE